MTDGASGVEEAPARLGKEPSARNFTELIGRSAESAEGLLAHARVHYEFGQFVGAKELAERALTAPGSDEAKASARVLAAQADVASIEAEGGKAETVVRSAEIDRGEDPITAAAEEAWGSDAPETRLQAARVQRRLLLTLDDEPDRARVEALERELQELSESCQGHIDRILGFTTVAVAADYQLAAFAADRRKYGESARRIRLFEERHPDEVHAALFVLRSRVQRAIGVPADGRKATADSSIKALQDEELEHDGTEFVHAHAMAALLRHRAVAEYSTSVKEAIATLETADEYRDRIINSSEESPVYSYALCRYHVMNNERDAAVDTTIRLLRTRKLPALALRFEQVAATGDVTAPPQGDWDELKSLHERHTRAVLAAIQVLRALGRHREALLWLSQMQRKHKSALLVYAHEMSLQRSLGLETITERPSNLPSQDIDAVEAFESERAQSLLARGSEDALPIFDCLSRSGWRETRLDGITGKVDFHRRNRNYDKVLEVEAEAGFATPPPDLDIAMAWAELQLGDPRIAMQRFHDAVRRSRYSISGWVGVVRCLRLLGRTSEAVNVLRELQGEAHHWPDVAPVHSANLPPAPELSLRHGALLSSEEGWCWLDIDCWAEARTAFRRSLDAAPYFLSAQRGIVAVGAGDSRFDPRAVVDSGLEEIDRSLASAKVVEIAENNSQPSRTIPGARSQLLLEAARVCSTQGRHEEADRLFQETIECTPNGDRNALHRARRAMTSAYLDAGRVSRAEAASPWLRVINSNDWVGKDDRDYMLAVRYLLRKRRPEKARELTLGWEAKNADVPGSPTWLSKILVNFEVRDFDLVDEQLTNLANIDVQSDVIDLLGAWNSMARSELPGATVDYAGLEGALERLDLSSTDELHLAAIIEAKQALDQDRSIESALRLIHEAVARRPFDASLCRDAAAVHLAAGDIDGADDHIESARALADYDARTDLLAGVLASRRGAPHAAVQSFERAVRLDPLDHVHHRALAVALGEAGRPKDAIEVVDRGLERLRQVQAPHPGFAELELVRSRCVFAATQGLQKRSRQPELIETAERLRLIRCGRRPLPPLLRDEFVIREAFLRFHAGQQAETRDLLDRVKLREAREWPEFVALDRATRSTASRLPSRPKQLLRFGNRAVVAVGTLVLLFALVSTVWSEIRGPASGQETGVETAATAEVGDEDATESTEGTGDKEDATESTPPDEPSRTAVWEIIAGLVALQVLLVLPDLIPRLTSITVKDVSIGLKSLEPVNEYVHVDLDLSAARLVQISGFVNHRPGVPLDDIESRIKDSLPG